MSTSFKKVLLELVKGRRGGDNCNVVIDATFKKPAGLILIFIDQNNANDNPRS
jgi:hypothetical protein